MEKKTGMESLLRSMGLGEVLDAANKIAQSGAVPKILEFADKLGPLNEKLNTILSQQAEIIKRLEPGPSTLVRGPNSVEPLLGKRHDGDGDNNGPRTNGASDSHPVSSSIGDAAAIEPSH